MQITNSCLAITFRIEEGRLELISIRNKYGFEFLTVPSPRTTRAAGDKSSIEPDLNIWRMQFKGPDGEALTVGSAQIPVSAARANLFTWRIPLNSDHAQVRMRIDVKENSPVSRWSLSAVLPDGWSVRTVDFPIVPHIKPGMKMAAPFGWGLEYELKSGDSYQGTYPSLVAAMQFLAFYKHGHGLYIGAHDPKANHKNFHVYTSDNTTRFVMENRQAVPEKISKIWKLPYEIAIAVFQGDYYDAAQIYREWTFNAPWGKAGPVSKRPIPTWLKEADLWIRVKDVWSDVESEPVENLEMAKQASEFFGVPIALHWYTWHEIPFDTLYPEYFPAKPNFAEGVKALQEVGFHVMPYINGRLCDPNSKTWTEEGGEKWAARKENGEPYTEVYGSKVPLNVMCPYTPQWQQKIAGIVGKLTNEYGVDGVYIDQISAAAAVECFDPEHGHPIGGGHFWFDGYRKLLDQARKSMPRGRILTTEENAECWLDQFDALLLVNTPVGERKVIPLFPAVYSGRTITFGFQYTLPEDLRDSAPWRAKMAQAFVFGSQLGWVSLSVLMDTSVRREAEFLRTLAHCRRFGHEYVTYGRMLGMLEARGDNPEKTIDAVKPFGGRSSFKLPTVLASAWQAEDGSLGIVMVNQSDQERLVSVRLPLERVQMKAQKGLVISRFGPTGEESEFVSFDATQSVTLPAGGAAILKVRQNYTAQAQ